MLQQTATLTRSLVGAFPEVMGSVTKGRPMSYLVGVLPLGVQQVLTLNPAGQVVTQTSCHDLPQVCHLALCRRLHFGVQEKPSFRAHCIHCEEGEGSAGSPGQRKADSPSGTHPALGPHPHSACFCVNSGSAQTPFLGQDLESHASKVLPRDSHPRNLSPVHPSAERWPGEACGSTWPPAAISVREVSTITGCCT